jgi:hypothetical protein
MLASAIGWIALLLAVSPETPPSGPAQPSQPAPPTEVPPAVAAERPYEGARAVEAAGDETAPTQPDAPDVPGGEEVEFPPARERPEAQPPARHRLVYRNLVAARYNPLGFVDELFLGYRLQLVRRPGLLWRDSFLATHAHVFLNPAYARVGPHVELQPLAIWQIAGGYDVVGYFGAFDQLASFTSPSERYDDDVLDARGDAGRSYATFGHFVTLSNLLQLKVKSFAVRDSLRFYWSDLDLRTGDRVWYDQAIDILMPDRGWALTNDVDAVWLFDFGLVVGARYTLTHAFYRQAHFRFGEPVSRPNGPTHRVGPAVLYTFFERPGAAFDKPTIIVLAQWWVRHRWRTGEVGSAATPYVALAFAFEGELWPR